MNKKEMKLYVWYDFEAQYGAGLAFAIASSLDEAMIMVAGSGNIKESIDWGTAQIYEVDTPIGFYKYGDD